MTFETRSRPWSASNLSAVVSQRIHHSLAVDPRQKMKVCRSVLFAVLVAHHVDHFRCQVGLSDAVQARDKAFQWLVDQADAEVGVIFS